MKDFLNLRQTAELLGVHSVTVNRYCKQGKITYYQIGSRKRFLPVDIETFKEGAKRNATEQSENPFNTK